MSGDVIRIDVNPDAIPDALRDRETWVCWRVEQRDGDPTKVPVDPNSGNLASSTDDSTWASFSKALGYHTSDGTNTAGIGYVFAPTGPFAGIDLDDCRDPETGELDEWAADVLDRLDTYAEVSPSGTGAHAYVRGDVPNGGNRSGSIEMYDEARFFTVTGARVEDSRESPQRRQDALDGIHADHINGDTEPDSSPSSGARTPGATTVDASDEELIEKAKNADDGGKFRRLWRGDTSGYDSHSEARMALLNKLAFWTGGDADRIDDLYRDSGLYPHPSKPGKWDRLADEEISKAINGQSEFYDPGNTATADGGTASEPASTAESGPGTPRDRYQARKEESGASTNAERASVAWEILRDELDVLAVEPDGDVYTCHDGVWTDGSGDRKGGEQVLREHAHTLMGSDYSKRVFNELVEQVRATSAIHRSDMGVPAGYIPVANGLLSVADRDLRPIRPDDHVMARLPVEYDPAADCDRFEAFIADVTGNAQDRRLLQEYVGYTLMHWALPYHRHLFLAGPEASGKSTFLDTVRSLLGDELTCSVTPHGLTDERFKAYQLRGAWANIRNDIPSDLIKNAGAFKEIMAGDEILVEQKNRDPFTIRPKTKHLFAANTLPTAEDEDPAFFRRIILVSFPTTIPRDERDPHLADQLRDELPGVLNWALDGLDRLQDRGTFYAPGTGGPEAVKDRWDSFGKSVKRFKSHCLKTKPDGKIAKHEVYDAYTRYCAENGLPAQTQRKFTRELKKDKDISDGARVRGDRAYTGIELIDDRIPDPPSDDGDDGRSQASLG